MPNRRRRARNDMTLKWQRISLVAGTLVVCGTCLTLLATAAGKYTEIVTLQPRKIEALETNYRTLATGQTEMSHRIDAMSSEISGVSQRLEMYSKRADDSQRSNEQLLNKIAAIVDLTRTEVVEQGKALAGLREKAINTAVAVDDLKGDLSKK